MKKVSPLYKRKKDEDFSPLETVQQLEEEMLANPPDKVFIMIVHTQEDGSLDYEYRACGFNYRDLVFLLDNARHRLHEEL